MMASPSLDLLYRLNITWKNFNDNLFLGEMLGASLFLAWLLRSTHLGTAADQSNSRFSAQLRSDLSVAVNETLAREEITIA